MIKGDFGSAARYRFLLIHFESVGETKIFSTILPRIENSKVEGNFSSRCQPENRSIKQRSVTCDLCGILSTLAKDISRVPAELLVPTRSSDMSSRTTAREYRPDTAPMLRYLRSILPSLSLSLFRSFYIFIYLYVFVCLSYLSSSILLNPFNF